MGRVTMATLLIPITALLLLFNGVSALHFEVVSTYSKCFSEYMHVNGLALVNFHVVDEHASKISVKVTSPYGSPVHTEEGVSKGEFAFTAYEEGDYTACFWVANPPKEEIKVAVNVDWKTGVAAKDYQSIAKREKIEGVELELIKLKDAVKIIHENMLFLRSKEESMRHVSEKTNTRMAWYSVASLFICVGVAGLQVWYLKSFFVRKKLL